MKRFFQSLIERMTAKRGQRASRGQQMEDRIGRWFEKRYEGQESWNSPGFDGYADAPQIFRILNAHWRLEYNISNGGWGQFLWNCRGGWPILLRLAEEGYRILECPEQVRAVKTLRRLCKENEADCDDHIRQAVEKDDFSYFGAFCNRGYADFHRKGKNWQESLYDTDGEISRKRHAWLVANAAIIRDALKRKTA